MELEKLKKSLQSKSAKEQEQIYVLCKVMEICGGYTELMNLPLPALNHIIRYIEYCNKEQEKAISKSKRRIK